MDIATFTNAYTDTKVRIRVEHISFVDQATADTTTITTVSGGRVTVKGTEPEITDAIGWNKKPGKKEMETR